MIFSSFDWNKPPARIIVVLVVVFFRVKGFTRKGEEEDWKFLLLPWEKDAAMVVVFRVVGAKRCMIVMMILLLLLLMIASGLFAA